MSGRWPARRSPWLGEGTTLIAVGLSGVSTGSFGSGLLAAAFALDAVPSDVDRGEARRRDANGLLGQPARNLAIRMKLGYEEPIPAFQLGEIHAPIPANDPIRIVGQIGMA